VAGLLKNRGSLVSERFRSPHHSASGPSLVGGSFPRPGEISLGRTFLDELTEFKRDVLFLRQPLEDGYKTISRSRQSMLPAQFTLL